jgi:tetratricopeptide (TPR) repeat protein
MLGDVEAIVSTLLALAIVGAMVALAIAIAREMRNDTVLLEPVDVPSELARRGFHPAVVAKLLLDGARTLQRATSGERRRRPLDNVAALADLQLPGGRRWTRAIVHSTRSLVGRPAPRIGGAITRGHDGYRLRLWCNGHAVEPIVGHREAAPTIESLLQTGAEDFLQAVDPFSLASFYQLGPEAGGRDHPNTLRLVRLVLRSGGPEDRGWALGLWGTVLIVQGHLDEAMEKLRQSVRAHHPIASSVALANLALLLMQRGKADEARAEIERVAARRPLAAENLSAAGTAYAFLGDWDSAAKMGERAVRLAPKRAEAYVQLGHALGGLHRHQEAIDVLRRAHRLKPELNWAEFMLAWQLTLVGRVDEARAVASDAVARVPDGFHQRMALAFVELASGDFTSARQSFEVADRAFAHYEICKAGWGDALLAGGEPDAAIEKYREAITENERTASAWLGWGRALARLGRHTQALEKFERAARWDSHDPAIYRAWADALDALGRGDKAAGKRRRAAEIERTNGHDIADTLEPKPAARTPLSAVR